jgi:hypothetical protein
MKGKINIKTVIVMLIVVLVIILGVIGVKTAQTFMTGAAGGTEPKNVTAVSSEDGKSATITWTSDKEAMGVVQYGPNVATLLLTVEETSQTMNHSVLLTNLGPGKTYYFKIVVGSDTPYDDNGVPWSFKTKGSTIIPTIVPEKKVEPTSAVLVPTISSINSSTSCNRTTDYNKDGTINSIDYNTCVKDGGSKTIATPTTVSACSSDVDYNNDGTINSLDRIKCLQSKTQ